MSPLIVLASLALLLSPILAGSLDWTAAGAIAACILALGAAQLVAWMGRSAVIEVPPVTWMLLVFAAIQTLSLIGSVNRDLTLKAIILTVAAASLALVLGSRAKPSVPTEASASRDLWNLLLPAAAAAASLAYVSVLGIREYAQNYRFDPASRIFSTFFNPDITAEFIGMALLVCICLLWLDLSMAASFALAVSAIMGAAALALTGSKGGGLSFLIGLSVLALVRRRTRSAAGIHGRWFVPVLALCAIAAGSLSKLLLGRIAAASTGEAHSMLFRKLVWKSAFRMMLARPLTGFGAGAFSQAYGRHAIAGPTMMAHSSFLQAGAENGVAGVILLIAATAAAFAPLVRLLLYRRGAAAASDLALSRTTGAGGRPAYSASPSPVSPGPTHREKGGSATVRPPEAGPGSLLSQVEVARVLVPGLAGALALSAAHNFIDFGWGVPGVWLVFWGLAGLLAAAARTLETADGKGGEISVIPENTTPKPRRQPESEGRPAPDLRILAAAAAGMMVIASWSAITAAAEYCGDAARAASQAGGPESSGSTADLPQAVDLASTALRLDPLDGASFMVRAGAEMALAAPESTSPDVSLEAAAVRDLNRAARLMPDSAAPLWLLGRFREATGQIAAAEQSYRAALQRDPHVMEAALRLAGMAMKQHRPDAARRWYTAVTAVESSDYARVRGVPEDFDTHYLEAWAGLVQVDSSQGRWKAAAADGEHALGDLEEYARAARLHHAYETIWSVYDAPHRQTLTTLAHSVVRQLDTALAAAGRSAEIPAVDARQAAFDRAMASIKEPTTAPAA